MAETDPATVDAASPAAGSAVPPSPPQGRLHRVRLRKGQGDPIVLIHGFGADHNSWRILAAAAALSRPLLAVDLPGHGRSPGGATTIAAMAADVAATLAEEGVTTADLVGHSLGAAVAVTVAEAAALHVRSLFLLSPAGLGPDINSAFLTGFCAARTEESLRPWMELLVADPTSLVQPFVTVTAETRARPGVAEAQAQIARHVFPDGNQMFSVREALAGLTVPIRVVFGAADRIIPARHMAGLPGTVAQHLFPDIGHMPQVEARDAVARLFVEHLRSVG